MKLLEGKHGAAVDFLCAVSGKRRIKPRRRKGGWLTADTYWWQHVQAFYRDSFKLSVYTNPTSTREVDRNKYVL